MMSVSTLQEVQEIRPKYINNQYNRLNNNTAQLYFISGRAELHWNSSLLKNNHEINRFLTVHTGPGKIQMQLGSPYYKI